MPDWQLYFVSFITANYQRLPKVLSQLKSKRLSGIVNRKIIFKQYDTRIYRYLVEFAGTSLLVTRYIFMQYEITNTPLIRLN